MPDGYGVDLQDLTTAAGDVLECVDSVAGMSLESVSGNGEWYGNDELYQAFGEFGVVWQVAATVLGSRLLSAAGTLGAAAESYTQSDDSSQQLLSQINAEM